jgi:hypothetical protein
VGWGANTPHKTRLIRPPNHRRPSAASPAAHALPVRSAVGRRWALEGNLHTSRRQNLQNKRTRPFGSAPRCKCGSSLAKQPYAAGATLSGGVEEAPGTLSAGVREGRLARGGCDGAAHALDGASGNRVLVTKGSEDKWDYVAVRHSAGRKALVFFARPA